MWSSGCIDLQLGEDWPERLTLREYAALAERHFAALVFEDKLHARTAAAFGGVDPVKIALLKWPETQAASSSDGCISWDAISAKFAHLEAPRTD